MVAQAAASHADASPVHGVADAQAAPDSLEDEFFQQRANRGGIRRLVASVTRLIDIQYHIWLTEAKLAVAKIVTSIALFGAAALVGILGIIFLFIGVFHVLTDLLGLAPVWAYLIFAFLQLGLAVVLVLVAKNILGKKDNDKTAKGGK